ncbi:hypothetical protein MMC09_003340 [Bachmanniomyces sp. S44760]|nr:hypothetical protein [Bachmanniomyces sp. S44760]
MGNANRVSGIPRLSKLPQLAVKQAASKSDKIAAKFQDSNGADFNIPKSRPKPSIVGSPVTVRSNVINSSHPKGHDIDSTESTEEILVNEPSDQLDPARPPRPSLSDRAIDTLAQIPPSPAPRRRKSSFYTLESPMKSPSRPESSMNRFRPPSSARLSRPEDTLGRLPLSPSKKALGSGGTDRSTPSKRSSSSYVPRYPPLASLDSGIANGAVTSKLKRPSVKSPTSIASPSASNDGQRRTGSKDFASRTSNRRSPVQSSFNVPIDQSSRTEPGTKVSTIRSKQSMPALQMETTKDRTATEIHGGKTLPKSSAALRETIAKAKASRRIVSKLSKAPSDVPRGLLGDQTIDIAPEADPHDFNILESSSNNVLRKRINQARKDGLLNIAALELSSIPDEVMRMYDFDVADTGGVSWYEAVDLVRLNAADNEITDLGDDIFPDIAVDDLQAAEETRGNIFGGLEVLDFHGNHISSLPLGLRRLERLTNLNLSRNKLSNSALNAICTIGCLRELRLTENLLQGDLPDCFLELTNLEVVDLRHNKLSNLPSSFNKIKGLKRLLVADNQLTAIPFDAMASLPLIEADVSKNCLSRILIAGSVPSFSTLQNLDASGNRLIALSEDESLDLPSLQILRVSNNKLSKLPDVTSWTQLLVLTADNNAITDLPETLSTLPNLKNIDLSNNSMKEIDARLGLMENLKVLNVGNNPLRERRFLKLNVEDLKLELLGRLSPQDDGPLSPTGSTANLSEQTKGSHVSATWPVKSGVLDCSRKQISNISDDEFDRFIETAEVKSVILQRNLLKEIPLSIMLLGETLSTLDLSHNKLSQSESFLTGLLKLPNLQSLNLTSNSLTTLSPISINLEAPKLTTLILSFNRLTQLPSLSDSFPKLSTLLASNNALRSIEIESIRGLQVLDISSNNIDYLPPAMGLLQGQLTTLMVGGNKFRVPGWTVLEKGTDAILAWLRKRIPIGEEGFEGEELD